MPCRAVPCRAVPCRADVDVDVLCLLLGREYAAHDSLPLPQGCRGEGDRAFHAKYVLFTGHDWFFSQRSSTVRRAWRLAGLDPIRPSDARVRGYRAMCFVHFTYLALTLFRDEGHVSSMRLRRRRPPAKQMIPS